MATVATINLQLNYMQHRINRGVPTMQAARESLQIVAPEMVAHQTVPMIIDGQKYNVFQGGPDSNPWFNLHRD